MAGERLKEPALLSIILHIHHPPPPPVSSFYFHLASYVKQLFLVALNLNIFILLNLNVLTLPCSLHDLNIASFPSLDQDWRSRPDEMKSEGTICFFLFLQL